MELRFQTARTTKDLDFTVRVAPAGRDDILLKQIQDAGTLDLGDFFSFRIGEAMMDLDGAPYGGARYPVESLMGGRTFVKFHFNVGMGDVVLDPLEQAHMRDWLGFAGILPPAVPMIQREQQFVEKLHAYTLPRTTPHSRVRDLVDMALLIQSGTLQSERVVQALHATFDLGRPTLFPRPSILLSRIGTHHLRGWRPNAISNSPLATHSGSCRNSTWLSESDGIHQDRANRDLLLGCILGTAV